ncbi:MAG: hypothetical protein JWM74_2097 [Myxococcaceae bacterium]|nr:hypothetical protein [Myxococcaceae bacterium]
MNDPNDAPPSVAPPTERDPEPSHANEPERAAEDAPRRPPSFPPIPEEPFTLEDESRATDSCFSVMVWYAGLKAWLQKRPPISARLAAVLWDLAGEAPPAEYARFGLRGFPQDAYFGGRRPEALRQVVVWRAAIIDFFDLMERDPASGLTREECELARGLFVRELSMHVRACRLCFGSTLDWKHVLACPAREALRSREEPLAEAVRPWGQTPSLCSFPPNPFLTCDAWANPSDAVAFLWELLAWRDELRSWLRGSNAISPGYAAMLLDLVEGAIDAKYARYGLRRFPSVDAMPQGAPEAIRSILVWRARLVLANAGFATGAPIEERDRYQVTLVLASHRFWQRGGCGLCLADLPGESTTVLEHAGCPVRAILERDDSSPRFPAIPSDVFSMDDPDLALAILREILAWRDELRRWLPNAPGITAGLVTILWNVTAMDPNMPVPASPYGLRTFPDVTLVAASAVDELRAVLLWRASVVDLLSDVWDVIDASFGPEECALAEAAFSPADFSYERQCGYCFEELTADDLTRHRHVERCVVQHVRTGARRWRDLDQPD